MIWVRLVRVRIGLRSDYDDPIGVQSEFDRSRIGTISSGAPQHDTAVPALMLYQVYRNVTRRHIEGLSNELSDPSTKAQLSSEKPSREESGVSIPWRCAGCWLRSQRRSFHWCTGYLAHASYVHGLDLFFTNKATSCQKMSKVE